MAGVDFVALSDETTHLPFNDLRLGRSRQQVVCRLVRFWDSRNVTRDNKFMGISLLLLDEKNSMIHGFIPSALVDQYRNILREGLIYRLESFVVGRCTNMYKITKSPFVIRFMDHTVVAPVQPSISIEGVKFSVRNVDHLQALANTNLELPDVVGQIRFMQGSHLDDPTSTERVVVRYRVDKDVTVCLSLWDDVAATFRTHILSENHLQSIMVVTTVNPQLFGGNLFLNSTPSTRFYFDPTIDAITKFRRRMGINGETTNFKRADTTESLGKLETVTICELQKYISRSNEEIQDADFLCKATVERVLQTNGWSYKSCGACNRKLERNGSALRCNRCVSSKITGIVRYRVEFSVKDGEGNATFVVFDSEMMRQTSKTAAALTVENDDGKIPPCLESFVGKTYVFKIRVSPFHFTPNHTTFTVSTMTEHNINEVQVEEEATVAEMVIEPEATPTTTDAPHDSPGISVEGSCSVPISQGGPNRRVNVQEGNDYVGVSTPKRQRE